MLSACVIHIGTFFSLWFSWNSFEAELSVEVCVPESVSAGDWGGSFGSITSRAEDP